MNKLLDSWKEIAAYLRRSERTVQRWEREEGLPVHRHPHSSRSSVFAYTLELDKWKASRGGRRPWRLVLVIVVAAVAGITATWRLRRPARPHAPVLPVPLTAYQGNAGQPSLSPDGTQVAFTWDGEAGDNFDIFVKRIDTGDVRRLTHDPARDHDPAWSPDGRSVAFLRDRSDRRTDVLMVPAEGGPEHKFTDINAPTGLHTIRMPGPLLSWTPDGRALLVAHRDSVGEPSSIFLLPFSSSAKRRLTFPDGGDGDGGPALAPDGRTLAFYRSAGGTVEIYLQNLNRDLTLDGPPRRFPVDGDWNAMPVWMPGGRELLFASYFNQVYVIRRASGDGENAQVLAHSAHSPAISANGRRLVCVELQEDANIWRIGLEPPHAPVPMAREINSNRLDFSPEFSPDGKSIALVSARNGSLQIYLCRAEHCAPVTAMHATVLGGEKWSPDGRRIAFFANTRGLGEIYVLDLASGGTQCLVSQKGDNVFPGWSRDGKWIYFASNRSGTWQAWRVPAEGGEPSQVTRLGGFLGSESRDGNSFYYAKTSDLITELWRVPVGGGEELRVLEGVRSRNFAVAERGVYFVTAGQAIQYLPFGGRPHAVAQLEKAVHFGISLSPDEASLLFSQLDVHKNNLMLIENFPTR